jgi:predicted RNA-binding Zn-ribbon protein involved in translation (DUF1610 family)
MRIFRCHGCGWRGWLDEARLRYANTPDTTPGVLLEHGLDIVPDISLDGPLPSKQEALTPSGLPSFDRSTRPELSPDPAAEDRTLHMEQRRPLPSELESDDEHLHAFEEDLKPYSKHETDEFHSHSRHTGKACPNCGEYTLFRSRHKDWKEALRKKLTGKRPYRCHKCRWRGWLSKQL